jgi:hypothetical protein
VLIERSGDVRVVPETIAFDKLGRAELLRGLLARYIVVVPVESKRIHRIRIESDPGVLLVEEVRAVGSLLGSGIRRWPERADGSQADRDGKCNQPESMKGAREGHEPALSHKVSPVSSIA